MLLLFAVTRGAAAAEPPTVCLDPGHSAATVGARGRSALEYVVCWQTAQRLRGLLQRSGIRVVITKSSAAQNVSNEARAETANRENAALFLRLHCDAGSASGFASYYPARPGMFHGVTGPSAQVIEASHLVAAAFHRAAAASLNGLLRDRGLHTDAETFVGSRQHGALAGSIFAKVPVVLAEMCVITNPHDERIVASTAGQSRLAAALAAGVQAALDVLRHQE